MTDLDRCLKQVQELSGIAREMLRNRTGWPYSYEGLCCGAEIFPAAQPELRAALGDLHLLIIDIDDLIRKGKVGPV